MDSVAAAAKDKASASSTPPKRNRVADAIRAWQRCPKAWRAKLVEGGEKYLAEWVETANRTGLPGEQLLEDYKALITKYTQERDENGYPWAADNN